MILVHGALNVRGFRHQLHIQINLSGRHLHLFNRRTNMRQLTQRRFNSGKFITRPQRLVNVARVRLRGIPTRTIPRQQTPLLINATTRLNSRFFTRRLTRLNSGRRAPRQRRAPIVALALVQSRGRQTRLQLPNRFVIRRRHQSLPLGTRIQQQVRHRPSPVIMPKLTGTSNTNRHASPSRLLVVILRRRRVVNINTLSLFNRHTLQPTRPVTRPFLINQRNNMPQANLLRRHRRNKRINSTGQTSGRSTTPFTRILKHYH